MARTLSPVAVVFLVSLALLVRVTASSECEGTHQCERKCSGETVDLNYILKYPHNISYTETSTDGKQSTDYVITLDLCKGMNCSDQTFKLSAACQWKADFSKGWSLGPLDSGQWSSDGNGSVNVTYSGQTVGEGTTRTINIFITKGDRGAKFDGEDKNDNIFYVTIAAPRFASSGNIAGPIGWVLIALALIALVVYFIVGSIIMFKVKGARGIEIIPNLVFWKSLPFLIVDGCLFVISPCYKRRSDYEKI